MEPCETSNQKSPTILKTLRWYKVISLVIHLKRATSNRPNNESTSKNGRAHATSGEAGWEQLVMLMCAEGAKSVGVRGRGPRKIFWPHPFPPWKTPFLDLEMPFLNRRAKNSFYCRCECWLVTCVAVFLSSHTCLRMIVCFMFSCHI